MKWFWILVSRMKNPSEETIHGDENIKRYCHDNSIQKIKDSIEFIEKKRFSIGKVEAVRRPKKL